MRKSSDDAEGPQQGDQEMMWTGETAGDDRTKARGAIRVVNENLNENARIAIIFFLCVKHASPHRKSTHATETRRTQSRFQTHALTSFRGQRAPADDGND